MARKEKSPLQRLGPSRLDKFQITLLILTVDLVAYDWMTAVSKVHADLVHSARDWVGFDEREALFRMQF